jgi:putative aminopeptidase FrvX
VTAHKDEIALIVKRVEAEGRLRVRPLGGLHPWAAGEGPVEILGRTDLVPGVLSIGSKHVSAESPAGEVKQGQGLKWEKMWVETKLSPEALRERGVQIGSKVVLSRSRKTPLHMEGHICGHHLDCRGGVAIMMEVARALKEQAPAQDVYLIASSEEEVGAQGAVYAVRQLPADTVIALEIGPVASEYQTVNNENPIVLYQDGTGIYNETIARHLEELGRELGFEAQPATVTSFGSDASLAKKAGAAGRSACVCFPGENTHGYEISCEDGIVNCARLLLSYLRNPV